MASITNSSVLLAWTRRYGWKWEKLSWIRKSSIRQMLKIYFNALDFHSDCGNFGNIMVLLANRGCLGVEEEILQTHTFLFVDNKSMLCHRLMTFETLFQ